jgi:hypothetical protein
MTIHDPLLYYFIAILSYFWNLSSFG